MQVYKCFMKIIRQNLFLILMYLGIFIILTVAFSGFGSEQTISAFEDAKINVGVIDRDGSMVSEEIYGLLEKRHIMVELPDEEQALHDALYNRDVEYILTIPDGYGEQFEQGNALPPLEVAKVPHAATSVYVDRLVQSYMSTAGVYRDAGFDTTEAFVYANEDLQEQAEVTLLDHKSRELPNIYYYYKYLCYCMLLMMIFGLGPVLMTFGQKEIAMRNNASALPMSRQQVSLGFGAVTMAAVCFGILLIVGFAMYGGAMTSEESLICMLNGICFLVMSTALAFLIGHLVKSGNMLSAVANVVGMVMCFLGGTFVPLELMGETMQKLAQIFPTYWYINVTDLAYGGGSAPAMTGEVWQSMGMQLLFAVAFFALALVVVKSKRKVA